LLTRKEKVTDWLSKEQSVEGRFDRAYEGSRGGYAEDRVIKRSQLRQHEQEDRKTQHSKERGKSWLAVPGQDAAEKLTQGPLLGRFFSEKTRSCGEGGEFTSFFVENGA